MRLGSLFDGIGGFPLASQRCGIEPVWASEIEPFPVEVTKRHFPGMRHLGDVTQINGADIEPVDIITFGSPCQDLSVAGKREGLEGDRSSLFFHAMRIIGEMRDATRGQYPTFAIWENVPGAISSNKGKDFVAVVNAFIRGGRWTLHGEFWTHNISEYPSDAVESSLSQILQESVPEKYFLSKRACEGILRRAERRGKKLPPLLERTLRKQSCLNQEVKTESPEYMKVESAQL